MLFKHDDIDSEQKFMHTAQRRFVLDYFRHPFSFRNIALLFQSFAPRSSRAGSTCAERLVVLARHSHCSIAYSQSKFSFTRATVLVGTHLLQVLKAIQADHLIKSDELNSLRVKRWRHAFTPLCYPHAHFSATIDRFLVWLADATNAGLRQMYSSVSLNIVLALHLSNF